MSLTPNSPRCSVIMPMDRPGADALRAVASVLAQGERLLELIVVAALPRRASLRPAAAPPRRRGAQPGNPAEPGGGSGERGVPRLHRRRCRRARTGSRTAARFLDDNPGVLAVGGPDPAPADSTFAELVSDTLLATPWIGSGVAAHEIAERHLPSARLTTSRS